MCTVNERGILVCPKGARGNRVIIYVIVSPHDSPFPRFQHIFLGATRPILRRVVNAFVVDRDAPRCGQARQACDVQRRCSRGLLHRAVGTRVRRGLGASESLLGRRRIMITFLGYEVGTFSCRMQSTFFSFLSTYRKVPFIYECTILSRCSCFPLLLTYVCGDAMYTLGVFNAVSGIYEKV